MEDNQKDAVQQQQEALLRSFFGDRFGATLASFDKYLG